MQKIIIFVLILVLIVQVFSAGYGTSASYFLEMDASPVVIGQGSSISGNLNDISAIYSNPAGLNNIKTKEFFYKHSNLFGDINLEDISFGFPTGDNDYFACAVRYMDYGEFEHTDKYSPTVRGVFGAYSMATIIGYSMSLSPIQIGMNFKFFQNSFADGKTGGESNIGVGIDAGLIYTIKFQNKFFRFLFPNLYQLNIRHIGWQSGFSPDDSSVSMPTLINFGFSNEYELLFGYQAKYSVDVDYPLSEELTAKAGLEITRKFVKINNTSLSLRSGYGVGKNYSYNLTSPFSFGFGIETNLGDFIVAFDYAILPFHPLDNQQYMSLRLGF